MILVGLFSWWYGLGIAAFVAKLERMILSTLDFFSVSILFKTLFNPFRQIVGVSDNGSIAMQLRAVIDSLISRFIGAVIRLVTLLIGVLVIGLQAVASLLALLIWIVMPMVPIIAVVLFFVNGAVLG